MAGFTPSMSGWFCGVDQGLAVLSLTGNIFVFNDASACSYDYECGLKSYCYKGNVFEPDKGVCLPKEDRGNPYAVPKSRDSESFSDGMQSAVSAIERLPPERRKSAAKILLGTTSAMFLIGGLIMNTQHEVTDWDCRSKGYGNCTRTETSDSRQAIKTMFLLLGGIGLTLTIVL